MEQEEIENFEEIRDNTDKITKITGQTDKL